MPPSGDLVHKIKLHQEEQQEARKDVVVRFKERLSDIEELPAERELLRWIEATNGDLKVSESMLRKSLKWRNQRKLDVILSWRPPQVIRDNYPGGFLCYDESSCPVWLIPFGSADVRGMLSSCGKDDFLKFTIKIVEASLLLMRRKTEETGQSVTQHVFIFDLAGFSLAAATHSATIDLLRKLITIYEGNYPETLKAAYVINASTVFQLIFRVVQSSVQQKTLNKIKVFGSGNWDEIESLVSRREGRRDICSGGTVPQDLLFSRDQKVRRISVEPRQVVTFTFSPRHSCQLSWTFVCEAGDIGVKVVSTSKEESQEEVLLPLRRLGGSKEIQSGDILCRPGASYQVTFDNSFSIIRSKTISYRFVVDLMSEERRSDSSLTEDQVIGGLRTGPHFTSTEEDPEIVLTKLF